MGDWIQKIQDGARQGVEFFQGGLAGTEKGLLAFA